MYFCQMKIAPENNPKFYYTSKEGYRVFTKEYHLLRGYCCKNNCRHCPYGYDVKIDIIKSKK